MTKRILLSVPHMGGSELPYVQDAFSSNWLSTIGPNLDRFERRLEEVTGLPALALSSGTAAIHLGLLALGVRPGDEVVCPSLTFVASANPIRYVGATPIFIDSESTTWNLDPEILSAFLRARAAANRLPRAVEVVHLFGQCAQMNPILEVCSQFEIPVVEDAAEALGATYDNRPAGTLGTVGTLSFNGNKIITTTGGGALLASQSCLLENARKRSQQARDPGLAYEHSELGFNYRMSNVLAGIGLGQLDVLNLRVRQRRANAFRYRAAFQDIHGVSLMPQASSGLHTNWLSVFLIDERSFGCSRDRLIQRLDAAGVESRPVWKPMHMQPLFSSCEMIGGSVAADLFRRGICLPSSSSLTLEEQLVVINAVRNSVSAPPLKEIPPLPEDLGLDEYTCAYSN
ncbi:MAG: DegT/DnrJ/EryC1/StrS family aminotransferase [Bryobacteraceae bacterium]|nr:DegT/DnrJ/EryC1/StrS family aminotransferase [Bryobacteraceae bacterium]